MNRTFLLLAAIVFFFAVLSIDLYTDLNLGDKIDHNRGAFLRALGLLPCLFCFIVASDKNKIMVTVIVLCMVWMNYWNIFDGLYNVFRGHGWFFTGSEDGAADAKTDNFLQSIPLWAHIVLKVGGSISWIIIYLLTLKNKRS